MKRLGRPPIHGHNPRGGPPTPTYESWRAMKYRCRAKQEPYYSCYMGRGIYYCERWERFENFLEDMGVRPSGMSLDRINNDGNYEPGNCRWATQKEQANNSRQPNKITFKGETKNLYDWSRSLGGCETVVQNRLNNGWSLERALSTPVRKYRRNA